ncbi:phosphodiesterase [Modestobacter sp. NPDC049651]|uniref:phosphodiesterase n=1 Tax=unclassified Modestobacter TaxID=2643866 RepID=UPI0033FD6408
MPDLAATAGRAVAVAFAALTRATGHKPLHPHGVLFDAVLERTGARPPLGVPWLDRPGTDDVLVRVSRGAGLPTWLPDLLGLAIRVPGREDGDPPVDLLLSGSGSGPLTRQVPALHRQAAATYGSLMSYRSSSGPIALAAFPQGRGVPADREDLVARGAGVRFTLAAAPGRGGWRPFAEVELRAPAEPADPDLHFDSMAFPPPGLTTGGPMARFRRPSYAAARAVHDGGAGVLRAAGDA